jgi:NADH-quinone oxidoreductase subunit F
MITSARLLPSRPVSSLDEYLDQGGCRALAKALSLPRKEIVEVVKNSRLRGRGGGGFPTGLKWEDLLQTETTTYLVCNGAEGEPATFKDRLLMRRNPYQLLEGVAIAAYATGATAAYVAVKEAFEQEVRALETAMSEMCERDLLGAVPMHLHLGPDEYLFGEEKALMEVLEGKEPMPRMMPPYMHGLFGEPYAPNPTVSNNVETLFNVPPIVEWGPEWFRSVGTERSPGTMVLTLVGDVMHPGVYELPLGTPLRVFLYDIGGGPRDSREFKAVVPGSSHPVITPALFDTPMDFDSLAEAGSGLGTGFTAYDDTACMVRVAHTFSNFLYVESCAQCNPCKLHSGEITDRLARLEGGEATEDDLERILEGCQKVTDGQRCYLATAESILVQSLVRQFIDEFQAHIKSRCPLPREIPLPKLVDLDESNGRFAYDQRYPLKQPDWTYTDERLTY